MLHGGGLASCDESCRGDEVVLVLKEGFTVEAVQVDGGKMCRGWAGAKWMSASSDWLWRLALFNVVLAMVDSSWQGPTVWRWF